MADLVPVAAQVAPVNDNPINHHTMIAAVAITKGQLVYEDAAGKAALTDANGVATVNGIVGVALQNAAAGRPVDVLRKGALAGMGVGALAYTTPVYVSTTAGAISDTAIAGVGNVNFCIGRVRSMSDAPDLTKVLDIDIPGNTVVVAL